MSRGEVSALFLLTFEEAPPLVLKVFVRPAGQIQMEIGAKVARQLRDRRSVPTPQWLYSSPADDLVPYPHAVLEYATGEDADAVWPRLDREAKSALMVDCARTLSALHASDLTCNGPSEIDGWASDQRSEFDGLLESLHRQSWLPTAMLKQTEDHWRGRSGALTKTAPLTFVHYDFQLHNLRLEPSTGRITAVLDFDNATMAPAFTDARDMTVNVFLREPELSPVFWNAYGGIDDQEREILRLHCLVRVLGVLSAYSGPVAGLSGSTVERLLDGLPS